MKNNIDALKNLQQIMTAVLHDPQNITHKMLDEMTSLIDEAVSREEAQTVEPLFAGLIAQHEGLADELHKILPSQKSTNFCREGSHCTCILEERCDNWIEQNPPY